MLLMILLTVLKSTGPKGKEHSSNALRFATLEQTEFTKKTPTRPLTVLLPEQ